MKLPILAVIAALVTPPAFAAEQPPPDCSGWQKELSQSSLRIADVNMKLYTAIDDRERLHLRSVIDGISELSRGFFASNCPGAEWLKKELAYDNGYIDIVNRAHNLDMPHVPVVSASNEQPPPPEPPAPAPKTQDNRMCLFPKGGLLNSSRTIAELGMQLILKDHPPKLLIMTIMPDFISWTIKALTGEAEQYTTYNCPFDPHIADQITLDNAYIDIINDQHKLNLPHVPEIMTPETVSPKP